MFEAVGARYDGPELEKEILELWRRENVFGRIMAEGRVAAAVRLLRGPADRERAARHRTTSSRARSRTCSPLQDDARLPRARARRAGTRTACRSSIEVEKELGINGKKRIEQEFGIAEFNALCRASVLRLRRRMGGDHRADRLLGRHRAGVLHAAQRLHRDACGAAQGHLGQGAALPGPQGRALLPAAAARRCRRTRSPRATTRSRTRRSSCASRRSDERETYLPRLDDDAVDAAVERALAVHPTSSTRGSRARRRRR